MQDTLVENFTDKWNLNYKTLKVWDIEKREERIFRKRDISLQKCHR